MNVYVFRINYEKCFELIKSELLNGRLRQGWGCEGTDINGNFEAFNAAGKETGKWQESDSWFLRRYNILRIMLELLEAKQDKKAVNILYTAPKKSLNSGYYRRMIFISAAMRGIWFHTIINMKILVFT